MTHPPWLHTQLIIKFNLINNDTYSIATVKHLKLYESLTDSF